MHTPWKPIANEPKLEFYSVKVDARLNNTAGTKNL